MVWYTKKMGTGALDKQKVGEEGGAVKSRRGMSAVERGAWVCAGEGDGNKQLKAL